MLTKLPLNTNAGGAPTGTGLNFANPSATQPHPKLANPASTFSKSNGKTSDGLGIATRHPATTSSTLRTNGLLARATAAVATTLFFGGMLLSSPAHAFDSSNVPHFDPDQHIYFVPKDLKADVTSINDFSSLSERFFTAEISTPIRLVLIRSVGGRDYDEEDRNCEKAIDTIQSEWSKQSGFDNKTETISVLCMKERALRTYPGTKWDRITGFHTEAIAAMQDEYFVPQAKLGNIFSGLRTFFTNVDSRFANEIKSRRYNLSNAIEKSKEWLQANKNLLRRMDLYLDDLKDIFAEAEKASRSNDLESIDAVSIKLSKRISAIVNQVEQLTRAHRSLVEEVRQSKTLLSNEKKYIRNSTELTNTITAAELLNDSTDAVKLTEAMRAMRGARLKIENALQSLRESKRNLIREINDANRAAEESRGIISDSEQASLVAAISRAENVLKTDEVHEVKLFEELQGDIRQLSASAWKQTNEWNQIIRNLKDEKYRLKVIMDEAKDISPQIDISKATYMLVGNQPVSPNKKSEAVEQFNEIKSERIRLEEYVEQIKIAAQAEAARIQAEKDARNLAIFLGSLAAGIVSLITGAFFWRRRKKFKDLLLEVNNKIAKIGKLIHESENEFAEVLTEIETDRPYVVGLQSTQGRTKIRLDTMDDQFCEISAGITSIKDALTDAKALAAKGRKSKLQPLYDALEVLGRPIQSNREKVNQKIRSLFPEKNIDRTISIGAPLEFLELLDQKFKSAQQTWNDIKIATDISLNGKAENDLPISIYEDTVATANMHGIGDTWLASHPLLDPQPIWKNLEELRLSDPLAYVEKIAEARAQDDIIDGSIDKIIQTLRDINKRRTSVDKLVVDYNSTVVPTEIDPRASHQRADNLFSELKQLLVPEKPLLDTAQLEAATAAVKAKALEVVNAIEEERIRKQKILSAFNTAKGQLDGATSQVLRTRQSFESYQQILKELAKEHDSPSMRIARAEFDEAAKAIDQLDEALADARHSLDSKNHLETLEKVTTIENKAQRAKAEIEDINIAVNQLRTNKNEATHLYSDLDNIRTRLGRNIYGYGAIPKDILEDGDKLYGALPDSADVENWGERLSQIQAIVSSWKKSESQARNVYEAEQARLRAIRERAEAKERARLRAIAEAEAAARAEAARQARRQAEREAARIASMNNSYQSDPWGSSSSFGGGSHHSSSRSGGSNFGGGGGRSGGSRY